MNLVIDIGNTTTKAALFNENEMVQIFENFDVLQLDKIKNNCKRCIISSVKKELEEWKEYIIQNDIIVLNYRTPLPFQNNYGTPETLGMDRIASIAGAKVLYPNNDLLVIDAGTCITFDYLKNNSYEGGAISPGIQIKFKALHTFTSNLPLIKLENEPNFIGKSTKESILSGVINGTIAEINYSIEEYKRISDNLAVILCGGDAKYLSNSLKNINLIEKNLVLVGLNEILKYNEKQ